MKTTVPPEPPTTKPATIEPDQRWKTSHGIVGVVVSVDPEAETALIDFGDGRRTPWTWETLLTDSRCDYLGRATPAVPPEPAPPTLDPVKPYREALEAAKAESVAVCKEYNEQIDGFLKRGGAVRDEVYCVLATRLDAAMWSSQRVSEIVDRALAGTPAPAAAPPTSPCLLHGDEGCGPACRARAAPPTAAPAAEIAWRLVLASAIGDIALSLAERKTISKVITDALERDRASRSPGPVTALPGSLHGACVDPACRGYWDSQIAAITAHNEHNAPVWAELERIAQRAVDLSASAGLEGRLRPGSDEGAAGKAHGTPLSGLDAATVEAARLAWAKVKRIVGKLSMPDEFWDDTEALDDAIRALATPPGQAKP